VNNILAIPHTMKDCSNNLQKQKMMSPHHMTFVDLFLSHIKCSKNVTHNKLLNFLTLLSLFTLICALKKLHTWCRGTILEKVRDTLMIDLLENRIHSIVLLYLTTCY
jgi:hypothetical protein